MVDEDLAVNAEGLVEVFLVMLSFGGYVAHGEHICFLQSPRFPTTDLPEVRQRSVIPKQKFVGILIQLCNPNTILISRSLLRHDVHGDLRQIEIRADAHSRCYACSSQHVTDHSQCHYMGGILSAFLCLSPIEVEIAGAVDEAFVDGIHMDVLRCHIAKVDAVDLRRHTLIFQHPRDGNDAVYLRAVQRFIFPYFLLCFKQAGSAGHTNCLQRRRHRKADGLIRSGFVRHQQLRLQRVKPSGNALHRGIVGFQINANVCAVHGFHLPCFSRLVLH